MPGSRQAEIAVSGMMSGTETLPAQAKINSNPKILGMISVSEVSLRVRCPLEHS